MREIYATSRLYVPANGTGTLSNEWLQDRAAMLSLLNERNIQDNTGFMPYPADTIYSDADSGITLLPSSSGRVMDSIQKQIRFGSNSNTPETISGGSQDDRLYGMGGNDALCRVASNDACYEGGRRVA